MNTIEAKFPEGLFPDNQLDPDHPDYKRPSFAGTLELTKLAQTRIDNVTSRFWRYLKLDFTDGPMSFVKKDTRFVLSTDSTLGDIEMYVREFYELPETAIVVHQGIDWAVWAGDGEPDEPAFRKDEDVVLANEPAAASFSQLEGRDSERRQQATAKVAAALKLGSWFYSDVVKTADEVRRRFAAAPDALVDQDGVLWAVWKGDGPPTRSAFPGKPVAGAVDVGRTFAELVDRGKTYDAAGFALTVEGVQLRFDSVDDAAALVRALTKKS